MVRVKYNIVLEGLEGMLGKHLVFRQVNGRAIVSVRPAKPAGPPSPKQLANRERFRLPREWAKEQLKNPEVAAEWKAKCEGNQSAMSLLIGEYCRMKS